MSVENILILSNNFEMLKEFTLTEEELKTFNELPAITLEKQLEHFQIEVWKIIGYWDDIFLL